MDILIRSIPKEVVAQLDSIKGQLSREEFLRRKLAEIGEVPQVRRHNQGLRGFTEGGGTVRLVQYTASIGGGATNLTQEQFAAYQRAKLIADPRNGGNWQQAKEILEAAGFTVYWD